MAQGSSDDTLPIRCPGCGQRFKVGPELMGRMVECGTCEHRFRVSEDVLTRSKRYYPGDRKDQTLERFSRVPMASSAPAAFQQANYSQQPAPRTFMPTSPLRLMCGFLAFGVIAVVALMLGFGSSPGGVMDGADQTKRLLFAGFASVIGAWLLLLANPRGRGKALVMAVVAAAGLFSLSLFVKSDSVAKGNAVKAPTDELTALINMDGSKKPETTEEDPYAALKKEMGYAPMERALAAGASAPGKMAAALWLRDLKEYHKNQVNNYIIRATGADKTSHMYPRDHDYLMVVTGLSGDLDDLAKLCERFGEVKRKLPDLHVIEVVVKDESFQEGPLEKLTDQQNPSFYELNRRELESIDLERCRNAVVRLSTAKPISYRPDIVRRMLQLLKEGDRDMQGQIAKALSIWAQPGDGSLEIVRAVAENIHKENVEMPEPIIEFLASQKDSSAAPMVDSLWAEDPTKWEVAYSNLGPAAETLLLQRFPKTTPTLKMSTCRILARVGTAKAIPVLEAAKPSVTGELRAMIDSAIGSIQSRQ